MTPSRRAHVAAVVALGVAGVVGVNGERQLRIATFNIEYYPQSEAQAQKAFDELVSLRVPLIALQEITDTAHVERTARERLGPSWRAVFPEGTRPLTLALLYDGDVAVVDQTVTHSETVVNGLGVPVLEARVRPRGGLFGGRSTIRVFVVHLRAGGDNAERRREQIDAIEPVLVAARASGDDVVVLGDFNSTGDADRARIASLTKNARLTWASEALTCTCFWQRQHDCVGSALDQVLVASSSSSSSTVAGECARGCPAADRCPAWREEVSDHCPVVTSF